VSGNADFREEETPSSNNFTNYGNQTRQGAKNAVNLSVFLLVTRGDIQSGFRVIAKRRAIPSLA